MAQGRIIKADEMKQDLAFEKGMVHHIGVCDELCDTEHLMCSHAWLPPGQHTSPHYDLNTETAAFIVKGCAKWFFGVPGADEYWDYAGPGEMIYVPRGQITWAVNLSETESVELVVMHSVPNTRSAQRFYLGPALDEVVCGDRPAQARREWAEGNRKRTPLALPKGVGRVVKAEEYPEDREYEWTMVHHFGISDETCGARHITLTRGTIVADEPRDNPHYHINSEMCAFVLAGPNHRCYFGLPGVDERQQDVEPGDMCFVTRGEVHWAVKPENESVELVACYSVPNARLNGKFQLGPQLEKVVCRE